MFVSLVSLWSEARIVARIVEEETASPMTTAVVYLNTVGALKITTESMVQKNKEFIPHLLVVAKGSTVFFPNEDPIFHNIFSQNKIKKLDLGNYKGQSRPVVFEHAGVYPIGCEIHPWMSANILVLETPDFAVTNPKGEALINGLKLGKVQVFLWSENIKQILSRELELKEGINALVWQVKADELKKKRQKDPSVQPKANYE